MKVLLFVQNGGTRPRAFPTLTRHGHWQTSFGGGYTFSCPGYLVGLRARLAFDSADRWWLVECENAEDGRFLLKQVALCGPESVRGWPQGRILASGGRALAAQQEGR